MCLCQQEIFQLVSTRDLILFFEKENFAYLLIPVLYCLVEYNVSSSSCQYIVQTHAEDHLRPLFFIPNSTVNVKICIWKYLGEHSQFKYVS